MEGLVCTMECRGVCLFALLLLFDSFIYICVKVCNLHLDDQTETSEFFMNGSESLAAWRCRNGYYLFTHEQPSNLVTVVLKVHMLCEMVIGKAIGCHRFIFP